MTKGVRIPLNEVEIPEEIWFIPAANYNKTEGFNGVLGEKVRGKLVEVNRAHRWARYVYQTPQGPQHECFKF